MKITEQAAENAFDYLKDHEEYLAQLSAQYETIDERIKIVEAQKFLEAEGPQETKKMIARSSQDYVDLVNEKENIIAEFRETQSKTHRAKTIISVFQTKTSAEKKVF